MSKRLSESELQQRLRALERLAFLMDDFIRIPGTKWRLGWDSVLGILPGAGDFASVLSHVYLIWQAHQMGCRKFILARMLLNAIVDLIGGTPPILGDIFDVFWRSNRKNVDLIRDEIQRQYAQNDTAKPI